MKDINKKQFDEATKLKLDIFRECFREWLPVFIHNPFVEKTFIYDFFAGSGMDTDGHYGSPMILMDEARGEGLMYCSKSKENRVVFGFNEKIEKKSQELQSNVNEFLVNCLQNCRRQKCIYDHHVGNYDFKEAFARPNVETILSNPKYGKFILLDQYGFKEVDTDVFRKLVSSPKTDFIFFISSSFIKRFDEHPSIKKYIETGRINFDEAKPKECHREVANYFKSLIPASTEYYLHHFSIKKGTNYYGLIFGTSHSLGMEKFLKVCWEKDRLAGEANFDMFNDHQLGSLFYTEDSTNKIEKFKQELKKEILSKRIINNLQGLKFTLKAGIKTSVFPEVISEMMNNKRIVIKGRFNRKVMSIHRLTSQDIYEILIVKE